MAFTESDWSAYCPITIDHTKVPAGLPDGDPVESGFPVVLVIDQANSVNYEGGAANIFTTVVDYTKDIAITLDDGSTQVKHDIVEWNAADGSRLLVCHILVPSVASATDTTLRLYYRDDGAADQQQTVYLAADNWRLYLALHSSTYTDLTDNGNDGQDFVSAGNVAGKVGDAQDFDGVDDYIKVPTSMSIDDMAQMTFMAWLYPDTWGEGGNTGRVFDKTAGRIVFVDNRGRLYFLCYWSGTDGQWYSENWVLDNWQHCAITYDNGATTNKPIHYRDGVARYLSTTSTPTGTADSDAGADIYIGNRADTARSWDGYQDEFSLSDTIRSADWIATTYNCQNDNDAFWTVGAEVPVVTGSVPVILKMSRPKIMPARTMG